MSRLSRESIAFAAIAIADEEGVDAVSMRKVALRLGVGTMSLYHYVRDKQALYTAMADVIMASQLIPDDEVPTGWREGLAEIGRRAYALFTAHPWILQSWHDADRAAPSESFVHHVEQTLTIAAELEFIPLQERMELTSLIDEYVAGHIMHNLDAHGDADEWMTFMVSAADSGEYPHLTAAFADGLPEPDPGAFERGLQIVLDGIEATVERRR